MPVVLSPAEILPPWVTVLLNWYPMQRLDLLEIPLRSFRQIIKFVCLVDEIAATEDVDLFKPVCWLHVCMNSLYINAQTTLAQN